MDPTKKPIVFETSNINLATFIKEVKKIPVAGHRYDERDRVIILFEGVDESQVDLWRHQYLNSPWATWDATKQGFLSLMKHSKAPK